MMRYAMTAAVLALVGLVFVGSPASAQKEKEKEKAKAHSIKEIMKLAHTDKAALIKTIAADLKGAEVKWADVGKKAGELVTLSDELAAAKPKKGDEESWKKVTGEYHEAAVKLNAAAEKKDADAAKAAVSTLQSSCKGCHSLHK